MTFEQDKIKLFVEEMRSAYNDESYLSKICNLMEYQQKQNGSREYFQVGSRTSFPIKIISESKGQAETPLSNSPRYIVSQLVRGVAEAELAFLMSELDNHADSGNINSSKLQELSLDKIIESINTVENPDYLFLPMTDNYFDKRNEWEQIGAVEYPSRDNDSPADWILKIGDYEIPAIEIRPMHGIKNIFLVNSSQIDIVQKLPEDSIPPKEINPPQEYNKIISGHPFQLYFGSEVKPDPDDENYPEKIDMTYRVVLSRPSLVSPRSAYRLESPDHIELNTD